MNLREQLIQEIESAFATVERDVPCTANQTKPIPVAVPMPHREHLPLNA